MAGDMLHIDWHAVLVPSMGLPELVLRGSVLYLFIFAIMRLRKNQGSLNTADILVLLLIADAAQNGMAGEYTSVTEGLVLVGTVFGWNYLLDWLAFRFAWIRPILAPAPVPLIVNGRLQRASLKAEMLTRDDVLEQLREQGVETIEQVKRCCLEADGRISVIRMDPAPASPPKRDAGP